MKPPSNDARRERGRRRMGGSPPMAPWHPRINYSTRMKRRAA